MFVAVWCWSVLCIMFVVMKTISMIKYRLLPLLSTCALLLAAAPVAAEQNIGEFEREMLTLINDARRAPLATAESFGLDGSTVVADLPELAELLNTGLEPLSLNAKLGQAALEHTDDMLINNYYASESPDGVTVWQRLSDLGYEAIAAGETLGLLSFDNFMQPQLAAHYFFRNMFLDELDVSYNQQRTILNPSFTDVGFALQSGVMQFGQIRYNVYLATCDFGSETVEDSVVEKMEQQLLQLVNQARVKPVQVLESLGQADGLDVGSGSEILQPLAFNERLYQATQHRLALLDPTETFEADAEEVFTDRLVSLGYDVIAGGEIVSRVKIADYPEPDKAVQQLFYQIVDAGMNGYGSGDDLLFNEQLRDGAVSITAVEMTDSGQVDAYYVAVCSYALEDKNYKSSFVGMIYTDKNNDGLYNPGEGVADQPVIFYDSGLHLRSSAVGAVQSEVEAGGDLVVLFSKTEKLQFFDIYAENMNKWFDFEIGNL